MLERPLEAWVRAPLQAQLLFALDVPACSPCVWTFLLHTESREATPECKVGD